MATTPKKAKKKKAAKRGNGKAAVKAVKPTQVKFHYLKSPEFRAIHADGAIGGLTPSGHLHMAFYCERMPIPQTVTQKINKDGSIGDIITQTGKDGIVRQMETDIFVNEATAKNIKVWLDLKLEEFETRRQAAVESKKSK